MNTTTETETWRPIPGCPTLEASSTGAVRSNNSVDRRGHNIRGRILLEHRMRNGYLTVTIKRAGWTRYMPALVHRLVCEAFHGPSPSPLSEVCHGDGCRTNNRPENLRWGSVQDNADDRAKHGTVKLGGNVPGAKLTDAQAMEIRRRHLAGESLGELSAAFGVSKSNICYICKGRTFRHLIPVHPDGIRVRSPLSV